MGDILDKLLAEIFLVVGKGTKIDDAGVLAEGREEEGDISAERAAEDENDAIVKSTKSAAFIFLEFMSSND